MSNPHTRIASAALALAAASAGCSSSGTSQPPLPLSESNASLVAAEALITTSQRPFTVQLPGATTLEDLDALSPAGF